MLSEHEFRRSLSEAADLVGLEKLILVVKACAERYGWPIPEEKREAVVASVADVLNRSMH